MPTYLVRTIRDRDLVGIFVARDIYELALIVDECTDPGSCEYQRMKTGGLMWTGPAIPIPIEMGEDDDGSEPDPVPWGDAGFPEPPEPPRPPGPGHVVPFRKKR